MNPALSNLGAVRLLSVMLRLARQAAREVEAHAILILPEGSTDWSRLRTEIEDLPIFVLADDAETTQEVMRAGMHPIRLDTPRQAMSLYDQITTALLDAVANDLIPSDAKVVAIYHRFGTGIIDSLSVVRLGTHLDRLTASDLRKLETRVPLEVLKAVVDVAIDIGREGREGKPIGTILVVGDVRKVIASSHPLIFDPFRGYRRSERNIRDPRVREAVKEIAQMDGAIVIDRDGTVEAAGRFLDAPAAGITLSKGLGSRHWSAAAITKATKAIAIGVSQSTGTVRIFQNGEVVLRVEPMRRAMKWQGFDHQLPGPVAPDLS